MEVVLIALPPEYSL